MQTSGCARGLHVAFAGMWHGRPAGITFRPAAPDDADFLRNLYASTRTDELRAVPWPEEAKLAFLNDQFRLQDAYYRQAFADAAFLLILEHGERIGRIYLDRKPGEIMLIDIALIPARRGSGIGSGLLRELLAEAAGSASEVRLHVEPFNAALRLYQRLGFTLVERQGVYDLMRWTKAS